MHWVCNIHGLSVAFIIYRQKPVHQNVHSAVWNCVPHFHPVSLICLVCFSCRIWDIWLDFLLSFHNLIQQTVMNEGRQAVKNIYLAGRKFDWSIWMHLCSIFYIPLYRSIYLYLLPTFFYASVAVSIFFITQTVVKIISLLNCVW